jgi:cell fate (sporulation/competence/biofilm development) regulator YlbF (YheA/YmcA/DUF963 family)
MDLSSQAKGLARGIMETNEYKEFKNLRKFHGHNKEMMKMINDFKDTQFQLYQSQVSGKSLDPKKKAELSKKSEAISKEQGVTDYLKAETNFHNIMYNTYNKISQEIESSLK